MPLAAGFRRKLDAEETALGCRDRQIGDLIGPRAEQKIDDVPFVRLQPIQSVGRDRTDVDSINLDASTGRGDERGVGGDDGPHKRRTDSAEHLRLRAFDDTDEGYWKLLNTTAEFSMLNYA